VPFASKAQKRYFLANRPKLEAEGVNVDEWLKASKGKKLPERLTPKPPTHKRDKKNG